MKTSCSGYHEIALCHNVLCCRVSTISVKDLTHLGHLSALQGEPDEHPYDVGLRLYIQHKPRPLNITRQTRPVQLESSLYLPLLTSLQASFLCPRKQYDIPSSHYSPLSPNIWLRQAQPQ